MCSYRDAIVEPMTPLAHVIGAQGRSRQTKEDITLISGIINYHSAPLACSQHTASLDALVSIPLPKSSVWWHVWGSRAILCAYHSSSILAGYCNFFGSGCLCVIIFLDFFTFIFSSMITRNFYLYKVYIHHTKLIVYVEGI